MTILGLDFDNTLVNYDTLFHKLATEKNLLDSDIPAKKVAVRDYLRTKGLEDEFTILQGEVYGARILEAEPAQGMLTALSKAKNRGIKMVLVSHKTKTPYKGPKYDLHQSAWNWLEKHNFFDSIGLNWGREQVFFAETKAEKVLKIKELKCTHYVDDLIEILKLLPDEIKKIHYTLYTDSQDNTVTSMNHWNQLETIIK